MWLCLYCVFVFLKTLFSGWTTWAHVSKTAALRWSSNRATRKLCIGGDFPRCNLKITQVEIRNFECGEMQITSMWRYEIEKLCSHSSGERCATTTWTNTTMLWETGQRYARRILTMVTLPSMFLCLCLYLCLSCVTLCCVYLCVFVRDWTALCAQNPHNGDIPSSVCVCVYVCVCICFCICIFLID